MGRKNLLLITFLLILFTFQQTQQTSAAIFPINQRLLSGNMQNYALPAQILVKLWRLNPNNGTRYEPYTPCDSGYNFHGCVENPDNDPNLVLYYPYDINPAWVDVENDYLIDVVSREMPPQDYPNPSALAAQAVAARSYAGHQYEVSDPVYKIIANDTRYQVFIPYAFDAFLGIDIFPSEVNSCANNLNALQQMVCNAVTSTVGTYLALHNNNLPAKTEFSADWGTLTVAGDEPNIGIADPISICGVDTSGSHGRGMSQKGANRWALGNKCATASDGNQPWSVTWTDYRQILVHYYTGIDILDGSGAKVAPDDRWNLLWHNNFGTTTGTPTLTSGQSVTLQIQLQNTSAAVAANDPVVIGYKWRDTDPWQDLPGVPAQPARRGSSRSTPKGMTPPRLDRRSPVLPNQKPRGLDITSRRGATVNRQRSTTN